jgi:hypothetical protein
VIGKVCPRGQDMAGLIRYLYGPGRREEHTDPHIIAGYRPPPDLEPPLRATGGRDFRRLAGLLRLPHDVLGKWGYAKPVWYCSMRAAPEDRMLSDAEWAQIAQDVMHRTGLCPRGDEDDAVRWIAVRHGPDHIHLVAMLARQDRTRPRIVNERYRVRDACLAAEQRYGLRSTAPADRTAARRPTRAETGKAERQHRDEPARLTLRRHVSTAAASAASTTEFFARLDQAGVLVRLRYSTKNPGQVTGYAVALPGDTTKAGDRSGTGAASSPPTCHGPSSPSGGPARPGPTRRCRPSRPTRCGSTPPAPPPTPPPGSGTTPRPATRPPPLTRPAPPPTRCTQPPPRSAAAPCARPPTPTTAPPASPGARYPHPPRPGTSSGTPPG